MTAPGILDGLEWAGGGRVPYHTVQQGECLSAIASRHGLSVDTIWGHAENRSLRAERDDPNVLQAGDRIFVPERREGRERGSTEQRHRFRRPGSTYLRLRFLDGELEPRANEPCVLEIDGATVDRDRTDGDGFLERKVPPTARRATVRLEDRDEIYALALGAVDPVESIAGVQQRLHNLGIDCGPIDGIWGDLTSGGVRAFQKLVDREPTGELDEGTRGELRDRHGS